MTADPPSSGKERGAYTTCGNWGRLLRVDLTTGEISDWEIAGELYRDFLGGSGLAAYLFFELGGYRADPLSPDNPLFIVNGPLSGTSLPGCSRLEICARSPLTGIWGESSMGGHASPALKGTGYDGVVFTGTSAQPVYLYLSEGGAELRDASHLWGMDTFETEDALREELGDRRVQVMSIGPAGENLVRYAGVVNDRGSLAARSGMGAVMGSKKLKAVAVRGKMKYRVADADAYKAVRSQAIANIKRSLFAEGLNLFGTTGGVDLSSAICDTPVKNWREAQWKEGMESLSGVRIADTILTARRSCYACPIACKRVVEIKEGEYAMPEGPGPEYEGVGSLGFIPRISDMHAVVRANALCNAYGMDAISTGGTIAWAIEAFQDGLIDGSVTGGMDLDWGRPEQLIALIAKIARREGFGDELAEGCRSLAEKYGGREYAIHIKGMECPMHDPRALWSMGLGYATSIRGACHNRDTNLGLEMGMDDLEEIGFPRTRPLRREGKAAMTIHSQAIASICDSAVICIFAWKGTGSTLAILRDMLNAVTGYHLSLDEMLEIGNRIWYLKRAIGNLCGTGRADDEVPRRIVEPHLEGVSSDLLGALNPVLRANNRLMAMIKSEKLLDYVKLFNAKVVLRNTFRTVNLAGKLIPSGRRARERRGKESGFPGSGYVDIAFMLDEYYRLRRIDEKGYPEASVLEEMGLREVSTALHGAG
ncbi:MAG: aldehyde ferredoxin oxidoreductase family protein [Actinobacteria bacterium]|nr:aldehyde ferredoxin oxidoreductase family protein [Actinomycetota bacterium]